jgi:hypothetical protein
MIPSSVPSPVSSPVASLAPTPVSVTTTTNKVGTKDSMMSSIYPFQPQGTFDIISKI